MNSILVKMVLCGLVVCVAGPLSANTVGYWRFEPGAVTNDASGNGLDLVQMGGGISGVGRPAHGPGSMLSRPEGCSNALTNVIATTAERGPGSAAKYAVSYDGARMVVTLLSWNLDLDTLRAAAQRCAKFEAYFDPGSEGIPITTAELPGLEPGALGYQQTMKLKDASTSVYMAFQNVGSRAVFGVAFPTPNSAISAKAELPQTFLEIFAKQVAKLRAY